MIQLFVFSHISCTATADRVSDFQETLRLTALIPKFGETATACKKHAFGFRYEAFATCTRYWLLYKAFITPNPSETATPPCSKLNKWRDNWKKKTKLTDKTTICTYIIKSPYYLSRNVSYEHVQSNAAFKCGQKYQKHKHRSEKLKMSELTLT